MCEFKKGDLVEGKDHDLWGWNEGVFVAFDEDSKYKYVIRFDGCAHGFKQCRKVRPKLELDQNVWVRQSDGGGWNQRHFARWAENGKMLCWISGTTSHTAENYDFVQEWEQYSLTNPE